MNKLTIMSPKSRSILSTILGCLAFLCIPILTSPDFNTDFSFLRVGGFQNSFLNYCLLLVFFFVNYHILLPKFYYQNKKVVYFGLIIILFLAILFIPKLLPLNMMHNPDGMMPSNTDHFPKPNGMRQHFIDFFNTIPFLLVVALSFLLRTNAQLKEIKNEKLKAEISYLKAQINPHFLFNTLNSLYALTIIKSDEAPNAVLKLSNMMRYVVTESSQEYVPLSKEINYIKDYISLQKLRMNDDVNFSFNFMGDENGKAIAPLILISFIENAFKYGLNPDENSEISIEITVVDFNLTLITRNKMVVHEISEDLKTETGIENTKKRLEFIYPNKHLLEISEQNNDYIVRLNINLA